MTERPARDDTADQGQSDAMDRAVGEALVRARDQLLSLQDEQGWWRAELETNVTMDAEDLLCREFLGIGDPERTAAAARWIRSQQREDGTWASASGSPSPSPWWSGAVRWIWALRRVGLGSMSRKHAGPDTAVGYARPR